MPISFHVSSLCPLVLPGLLFKDVIVKHVTVLSQYLGKYYFSFTLVENVNSKVLIYIEEK